MLNIHTKSLQDLEFATVLAQVSDYCNTEPGTQAALEIVPFKKEEELYANLYRTSEYVASFDNNNAIPNHYFEAINQELQLLGIENSQIEIGGFRKINTLSETVNQHIVFFKKFNDYYPYLFELTEPIEHTNAITEKVNSIIDRFGEIKDDASPSLYNIRQEMNMVKGKISQSFGAALSMCHNAGFLDDIRESVVENRRVLAVKAMYRRRVKGTALGTSKTGSIIYIEPQATEQYTRQLLNLQFDEKEEINKILKGLTDFLRPFYGLLVQYQQYLTVIDVISAKARYAQSMNAVLPEITEERSLFLREAYHPLLYLSNKKKKAVTYPQTVALDESNRIIVISGPNAGGKSITLKTIGLLQLMLQSGMLLPVHERSKVCLFERILTDIGDNQSIENHLSTYSYRLKNMNYFLRKCNAKTLFLIDEFGTGSDPELGGALAETFLEEFYHRKAFGVITTHYSNLKMLANELPHASNANMLFDRNSLEPEFKLIIGEAGSSFTFEVAQKNGIPYGLINRAKKKIERGKVRFDETIAKLQKERSKMEKTSTQLAEEEVKAREEAKRLENLNDRIQSKLESYQQLYDHNQRMISLGNKVNDAAERFFYSKKKRPLVAELLNIVETENSKRKVKTKEQKIEEKKLKAEVAVEVEKQVEVIREKKKEEKIKKIEIEKLKPVHTFKVGDRVRLPDGKAVGTIDSIERKKAVINYGFFTTNVSVDQLELVEAKK